MSTHTVVAQPKKAVLIMEGEDGTVVVSNIFEPRFDREYHDDFHGPYVRLNAGKNVMTFELGRAFTSGKTEDGEKHANEVYAEARKKALLDEMEGVGVMPSGEDLIAVNFRTHEAANYAVYLAGIAAGARMVQFRDPYFEKKAEEDVMRAYDACYNAINSLVYSSVGKKTRAGLKKARKALSELRQPIREALTKKWAGQ